MKKTMILQICAILTVSGCATIVRGTDEDVRIETTPNDAKVVTSLNHTCQTNPCIVKVPRKDSFQVTASKQGYETKTVNVGTKVSGKGAAGIAGNVIAGGVIGVGVDAVTGAGRDHTPNPVIINLQPTNAPKPVEPKLKPAPKPIKKKPSSREVPIS